MEQRKYKNVVGPQVRRIRWQQGLKQKDLAAKLERAGWLIDRAGVSKIESRLMCVGDHQLMILAEVLGVSTLELLPKIDPGQPVDQVVKYLVKKTR